MAVKIEKDEKPKTEAGEKISQEKTGVSFIAGRAKKELAALTNLEPSTIMAVSREGEEWVVTLEMVEKKSIPDAMDILGTYEVRMNDSGQIINFSRISLRKRGDVTT